MKNLLPLLLACHFGGLPFENFAQSLQPGLVLHFSAEKPGADLSGNENHGIWKNISRTAGIPGVSDSAYFFNGSSSFVEVPASPSLNRGKSFTAALWFKSDLLLSANSEMMFLFRYIQMKTDKAHAYDGQHVYWLRCKMADLDFRIGDENRNSQTVSTDKKFVISKNKWYHVATTFDAEKRKACLFVNGVLSNADTVLFEPNFAENEPWLIGVRWYAQQESFFSGALDDLRIYDRALSAAEVKALTKGFVFTPAADNFTKMERLDAGRYIVQRANSAGQLGKEIEVVEVVAEEVFWKNGWFLACCIAAASLLTFVFAYFYNRDKQQEQILEFEKSQTIERERFRIAREMHDDIGSGLSAINLLTEIALNKSKNPQMAVEIARIATSAREIHARIQEIIWTTNLQNDTLNSLLHYLQRFATERFSPTGIALHFDLPENIPVHSISGERRRAVFLAFKEALQNVVKHAKTASVEIQTSVSDKHLSISIRDRGKGFDPKIATRELGNGLPNMKKRLEDVGGKCRIESGSGGTLVVLQLPL